MLALTYQMDPDFVGVPPWQSGHFLVLVALGQPEHLLPAEAEQVGAQVVPVKDVHHAVTGHHREADPEMREISSQSEPCHYHLPQKLVSYDFFTMFVAKVHMTNHQHPENDNHKWDASEEKMPGDSDKQITVTC